jgi:hypothetical protein
VRRGICQKRRENVIYFFFAFFLVAFLAFVLHAPPQHFFAILPLLFLERSVRLFPQSREDFYSHFHVQRQAITSSEIQTPRYKRGVHTRTKSEDYFFFFAAFFFATFFFAFFAILQLLS